MSITLTEMAEFLPLDSEPRVLQPTWLNPMSTEGVGLEFSVDETLQDLVNAYHDLLIVMSNMAQYMKVYCKPGGCSVPVFSKEYEVLGRRRDETDMVWHTDRNQRDDNATTIVVGQSPKATGIAPKHSVASACRKHKDIWQYNGEDLVLDYKSTLGPEDTGRSPLRTYAAQEFLFQAHKNYAGRASHHPDQRRLKAPQDFWQNVQKVNTDCSVDWVGETPDHYKGRIQALFLTALTYHAKQIDYNHYLDRQGFKYRLALHPEENLVQELREHCWQYTYADEVGIDADWVLSKKG